MSGFYELKCKDKSGSIVYYYFYSPRTIRNLKSALDGYHAPDAMRLTVVYKEDEPIEVKFMNNIFEYLYKRYFKKMKNRIKWEK